MVLLNQPFPIITSSLKNGDRFFYENGHDLNLAFSEDQIAQVKKTSLAALLCSNYDKADKIQPRVKYN